MTITINVGGASIIMGALLILFLLSIGLYETLDVLFNYDPKDRGHLLHPRGWNYPLLIPGFLVGAALILVGCLIR